MSDKFVCKCCNLEFDKQRSEEEAIEEFEALFNKDDPKSLVCEDCFIKIMDHCEPGQFRYAKYIEKN